MLRSVALAAIVVAGLAGAAGAQDEPEFTRREFGDWSVVCIEDDTQCTMQQIGRTAQGEDALLMEIFKLPEPQTVQGQTYVAVGTFRVPLGVLLTEGLSLQVDSGETVRAPFTLCRPEGCIVQVNLESGLVDSFIRGARARLGFVVPMQDSPQEIAATISLSGFTRAYNTLP